MATWKRVTIPLPHYKPKALVWSMRAVRLGLHPLSLVTYIRLRTSYNRDDGRASAALVRPSPAPHPVPQDKLLTCHRLSRIRSQVDTVHSSFPPMYSFHRNIPSV